MEERMFTGRQKTKEKLGEQEQMASLWLIFGDHTVEGFGGEAGPAMEAKVQQVVQGQRWEQQQGVGVTAGSAGKDNQGGAELSTALKEATRRRNLTLQLRHTQHCLAIVFVIQFQLSNFIS